jgi:hypothetical protein
MKAATETFILMWSLKRYVSNWEVANPDVITYAVQNTQNKNEYSNFHPPPLCT